MGRYIMLRGCNFSRIRYYGKKHSAQLSNRRQNAELHFEVRNVPLGLRKCVLNLIMSVWGGGCIPCKIGKLKSEYALCSFL